MSVLTENSGAPSYSMRKNNDNNILNENDNDENFENIIKLKLKKPDFWKWELSTSASTPNINFPRILLYNNDDELLADACNPDIIINCDNYKDYIQPTYQPSDTLSKQPSSLLSSRSDLEKRKNFRKSTSSITNSSSSGSKNNQKLKRRRSSISLAEINENLNDVFEYLENEGINYKLNERKNYNGSNNKSYKETSLKNFEHDKNNQLNLISSSSLNISTLNTNEANNNNNDSNSNNNVNKKLYQRSLSNDNFNKKTNKSVNCVKLEKPFKENNKEEGKGLNKRDFYSREFNNNLGGSKNNQNISNDSLSTDFWNFKSIKKSNTPVKEVRFADLKKSKSTTEILRNSSNSLDKKKCRRQLSTPPSKFSNSILERMSAFNMGSSADSHHDLNIIDLSRPKYFLRTSKAGTLVVCEESFSKSRRRPRSITKFFDKNEIEVIRKDKYYDNAIEKLDNLIHKVSLKENNKNVKISSNNKNNIENFYQNNNNLKVIENEKYRGKSVEKDPKQNLPKKQMKNIRRCISAGNVYVSSSEDEHNLMVPKLQSKLRRKRKSPFRMQKGEQPILKNNNNYNQLTPLVQKLPISNKLINNKNSIQQFDDYSINYNINENDSNNKYVIPKYIQNDSILKDFDENIEFEIIKNSNKLNEYDDDNDENNSNLSDDETILEILVEDNYNNNNIYSNNNNNNNNNMGSNVSRHTTASTGKEKERGRSHSSGDIHGIKHNNSSFYHLSSNNPNEKFNFDKNKKLNQIKLNKQKITTKYGINKIKYNNLSADNNIDDNNDFTKGNCSNLNGSGIDTIDINNYLTLNKNTKYKDNENLSFNMTFLNYDKINDNDRIKFCGSLPNNLDTDTFVNIDDDEKKSYYLLDTSKKNPLTTNITNSSNQQNTMTTDCVDYVTVTRHHQEQLFQNKQNNSMNCNSVGTENKISVNNSSFSTNDVECGGDVGSSGIKINQEKPDIQLILPLRNFDPSCDQGYGSERSPEEEHPPTILNLNVNDYDEKQINTNWNCTYNNGENETAYDFITDECTFSVNVIKGPRGLGLSISGGIDTSTTFPGIIRIKRIFPHQSAYLTGQLQPGDIILEANSIPLTGLTNYEALEVLRNIPNDVHLLICRPVDEEYKKLSPPTEPPKPPQRIQQQSIQTQTVFEDSTGEYYNSLEQNNQLTTQPQPSQPNFQGEFEIIMVKEQGSLGFTLRKEDESILGHYIRALIKEPALSDNRIKIGDKIVAVNDVDLSQMTHEQAVIFLRQSGDVVKLRLYRDRVPTPIESTTPSDNINLNSSFSSTGKKTLLRPEAINLLTDLAHKKQNSLGDSTESSNISISSSPRRLKRGPKSESSQSEQDNESKCSSNPKYLVSSQTSTIYSDSDQSIDSKCSYTIQQVINESGNLSKKSSLSSRPNFLNLSENSSVDSNNSTPKQPIYEYSGNNNVYNLNNLDNDTLDAPYKMDVPNNVGQNYYHHLENKLPHDLNNDFISLPCEVLLQKDSNKQIHSDSINNKNPVYQSVHINKNIQQQQNDQNIIQDGNLEGNESLFKWKGVVLGVENTEKNINTPEAITTSLNFKETGENLVQVEKENHDNLKELNEFSSKNSEGYKVISVELNRGWNSRLGFSLQPIPNYKNGSYISAIYNDSVAARDGRLKAGDILISVNDDSVENLSTPEIIDLLRILRGLIVITVLRKDL